MAWIESHQSLGRHPKTRKAARLLSVSRPAMAGHLHYLWWWCLDFAQDGDLSSYDDAEIAEAAEWEDAPHQFIEALIEAGFVTVDRHIHDWHDYAGKLIEQRKANAEKQKRWRERNKGGTEPADNPTITVTSPLRNGATVPNPTVPNPTQPDPEAHASVSGAGAPTRADEPLPPPKFPKPKDVPAPSRPPDLLFEAVCDACGIDWRELTDPERGKLNSAVGQIRKAGGTPVTVRDHAENYTLHFNAPLTPNALAGNWAKTANPPVTRATGRSPNGGKPSLWEMNARAAREA
jgi:hypothetical protein